MELHQSACLLSCAKLHCSWLWWPYNCSKPLNKGHIGDTVDTAMFQAVVSSFSVSGWEKNAKILDIDIHFCGFSFIHSYNILWASLTGLEYGMGLITFTSFHVPLSHDPSRGGVRARAHYAANLKLCLEATTSNVWFPATDNLLDGEIYLCAGALGHCACCGISTEHEFATKPDELPLNLGTHNYIDFGILPPKLHRYGDPYLHPFCSSAQP